MESVELRILPGGGALHHGHGLAAVPGDLNLAQARDLELGPTLPAHEEHGQVGDVF